MPLAQSDAIHITCDNPSCPGHDLDPADRTGWTFIHGEVYGEPTLPQQVFCGVGCLSKFTTALAAGKVDWEAPSTTPA